MDPADRALLERIDARLARLEAFHEGRNTTGIDPQKRYSARQVAERLGLSQSVIYDHVRAQNLKPLPNGTNKKVFLGSEVLKFIAKRAGGAA